MAGGPTLAPSLDPILHLFQGRPSLDQPVDRRARDRAVGSPRSETPRRTRRSRRRRRDRSWPAGPPLRQNGEPALGSTIRTSTPAARRASARPARNRRSPRSPLGRPGSRAPTPSSSASPSGVLAAAMRSPSERTQASTLLFATSRPTQSRLLCHPPLPSLLVRALTPMQLFGFKEDARPVPRSLHRVSALGGHGLRSRDGRLLQQPPVPQLCHISWTQGGPCEAWWRGRYPHPRSGQGTMRSMVEGYLTRAAHGCPGKV